MSTISVITPTAGKRPEQLKMLVQNTQLLLREGDQHIIIWDSHADHWWECVPVEDRYDYENAYTFHATCRVAGSVYGNAQRDEALRFVYGDWLVWCDDDDLLAAPGLELLRSLPAEKDVAHVFEMVYPGSRAILEVGPEQVRPGHIGGPQVVVPNVPDLPRWMENNEYAADWHWIKKILLRFRFDFHKKVLVLARPFEDYVPEDLYRLPPSARMREER